MRNSKFWLKLRLIFSMVGSAYICTPIVSLSQWESRPNTSDTWFAASMFVLMPCCIIFQSCRCNSVVICLCFHNTICFYHCFSWKKWSVMHGSLSNFYGYHLCIFIRLWLDQVCSSFLMNRTGQIQPVVLRFIFLHFSSLTCSFASKWVPNFSIDQIIDT